jgi:hypothetical protein
MGCEGQGCLRRDVCARYEQRNNFDLVSRVLCRGDFQWFILKEVK